MKKFIFSFGFLSLQITILFSVLAFTMTLSTYSAFIWGVNAVLAFKHVADFLTGNLRD